MRKQRRSSPVISEISPLVRLWMLRILVPLNGIKYFFTIHGYSDDTVAQTLGLPQFEPMFERERGNEKADLIQKLRQMYEQAEVSQPVAPDCPVLHQNVDCLAKLLNLSQTECRLLEFTICIHNEQSLDDASKCLGLLTSVNVINSLSVILDIPEESLRNALGSNGVLARSGLVTLSRKGTDSLRSKLDMLSSSFADLMTSGKADIADLLKGRVMPASKATLALADYAHIQNELSILLPFLRHAIKTGRKGVNILVHGAPGTGKSELARILAAELGCELYEVASEDNDGDPINGVRRLRALSAGQCFFAQCRPLMIFDETEDVLNDGGLMFPNTSQAHKAWFNHMLEENPFPVFWMSNSIKRMDSAFVRRFDMVFELPVPPRKQREKVVRQYGGDLLDEAHVAQLSEVETLAPAVVARAAGVAHAIKEELGREKSMEAFTHLVSGTLKAQRHKPLKCHDPNRLPEIYDPAFIHADTDLQALLEGIREAGAARLCLYGPPGTGKTAYGRWLARELEKPLLVKRASDLMSMWIGGTEENLADAFREAESEQAVLLIDEVDSFLQDRRKAQRSWEVTQVNEMLTQMEAFSGVFIASTNLVDNLDQAALRRFDLKAKFDFLRADQACALFERHCDALKLHHPSKRELASVATLRLLTPGDFAAVMRQHRFRPLRTADALLDALAAECVMKEGSRSRPIGFVQ